MLHYNPQHVSSSTLLILRRTNCNTTASGIVTLCKRPYSMFVERGLQYTCCSISNHFTIHPSVISLSNHLSYLWFGLEPRTTGNFCICNIQFLLFWCLVQWHVFRTSCYYRIYLNLLYCCLYHSLSEYILPLLKIPLYRSLVLIYNYLEKRLLFLVLWYDIQLTLYRQSTEFFI